MVLLPGIGMGERGIVVRSSAVIVLASVSTITSPRAEVPSDLALMLASAGSEYLLGSMLGLIPMLLIAGVQTAAQLASTSMGVGMGNVMDPTLGMQTSDLSRILGDISIVIFLLLGGHHVLIHAAAGLGGQIVPGTFIVGERSLGIMLDRTAYIFEIGVTLSAPVIVALLLTQFMLGLVSKAVPTVNIFIVSFPLTIGIGLILTILAFPDMADIVQREITGIENAAQAVLSDAASSTK
jgi:flagellar biosynthetic protein FliR